MLERKMIRDLFAWRTQIVAIAVIVACGIATFVAMQSVHQSLLLTKQQYYERFRFSHIFATLTRAPEPVAEQISAIDGVAAVQTRVVEDVTVSLARRDDTITARLITLPDNGQLGLNDVFIRTGRTIDSSKPGEAVVSEAFADANGLRVGDRIEATLNKRSRPLRIVGIGLSPEYVYEIRGATDIWPDNRHFGIIWVGRKELAGAFDLTGAFNNVCVTLAPGAKEAAVLADMDRILARYGSLGAIPASEQSSNRFLSDELTQLRVQAIFIPAIFLTIAAFLLNVSLSRLVASQREQIAILKALGFSNLRITMHYMAAVAVIMFAGAIAGTGLGAWLGWRLTIIYTHFYHFPVLHYYVSGGVIASAALITALAAAAGALTSILRAVRLPPAEAMRPPAPAAFHRMFFERIRLSGRISPAWRMILRNIERKPLAFSAAAVSLAFSVAIVVVGRYGYDVINYMIDVQFRTIQREDVTVSFVRPMPNRTRYELAAIPGVREIEPFRAVYARIHVQHRSRRVALLGLPRNGSLYRIVDAELRRHDVPADGLLLSKKLAALLGAPIGTQVRIEVLEERRRQPTLRVAGVVDDFLGLNAYTSDETLHRLLDEDRTLSGAYLTIDPSERERFDRRIKAIPAIASVSYRESALRQFERTVAEGMGTSIAFLIGFACAIAGGVTYNAGRILLSERSRELSTLRVLGFTRYETTAILIGEQAVTVAVAIPAGFLMGFLLCKMLQPMYETEVYRLPMVVTPATYAFAALVVLMAAMVSNWTVSRSLKHLDLLAVLKETD